MDERKPTPADPPNAAEAIPTAKVKPHGRFSWVWAIPILAAALVAYLGYTSLEKRGPLITLTLTSADGLQIDQTEIKHKAVPLGTVEDLRLDHDMSHVVARLRMSSAAKPLLTDHARFWVVRPRVTGGNLTGLDTLVSGAYIEVDPGAPGGKPRRAFTALDKPPGRESDEPGQVYVLSGERLGSLSEGAPVYFRDVAVGELLSYELEPGRDEVSLRVFVRQPYDRYVRAHTRFWNASGLSVTMGPEGMHLELESLQSVLSGSIAFETSGYQAAEDGGAEPVAAEGARFKLYEDKAAAEAAAFRENLPYVTYFETSVQGLACGSPVQLFGVQIGAVSAVRLAYDPGKERVVARVAFEIQPERLDRRDPADHDLADTVKKQLTKGGLKVVLTSTSLLTGAKSLAIAYAPEAKGAPPLAMEGDAIVLPSEGGGIEALTASLSDVANKVDKIPFAQIGQNVNSALESVQHLATQIDTKASPALDELPGLFSQVSQVVANANGTLGEGGYGKNSEFQRNTERALSQVNDAARSFRVLADYLDRHPEALIRGRGGKAGER